MKYEHRYFCLLYQKAVMPLSLLGVAHWEAISYNLTMFVV